MVAGFVLHSLHKTAVLTSKLAKQYQQNTCLHRLHIIWAQPSSFSIGTLHIGQHFMRSESNGIPVSSACKRGRLLKRTLCESPRLYSLFPPSPAACCTLRRRALGAIPACNCCRSPRCRSGSARSAAGSALSDTDYTPSRTPPSGTTYDSYLFLLLQKEIRTFVVIDIRFKEGFVAANWGLSLCSMNKHFLWYLNQLFKIQISDCIKNGSWDFNWSFGLRSPEF